MTKEEAELQDRDNSKNKHRCCGKGLKKAEEKVRAVAIGPKTPKDRGEKHQFFPCFFALRDTAVAAARYCSKSSFNQKLGLWISASESVVSPTAGKTVAARFFQ
jgi:hypothetical protein